MAFTQVIKTLGSVMESMKTTVNTWLSQNITNPSNPPLDRSLSLSNACAPADLVGVIRNEIPDLDNKHLMNLTWNFGYISDSNLSIHNGGTTHQYSDVVLIPAETLLYIPRVNKSGSVVLLAECDSSGTPIKVLIEGTSTSQSTGAYMIYPITADTYVRFGGNATMSEYMLYYKQKLNYDFVINKDNIGLLMPNSEVTFANGAIYADNTVGQDEGIVRSSRFCLPKGMSLEYWGCGTGSVKQIATISKWNHDATVYIEPIQNGSTRIQHNEYTAPENMFIRLSARIAPNSTDFNVVLAEELFTGWKIYYKPTHNKHVSTSPLYQKKLTVMGDSLMYGNKLGPQATWSYWIKLKYDMTLVNLGMNGNPVARVTGDTGMVDRMDTVPTDTEIFVLNGGANDRNDNVPIGNIDSTDPTEFCGALNTIITTFRQRCPKAKFLLLTNWQRYATNNYIDKNYVDAMIAVAKNRCVPVFDNWRDCGITFLDSNQKAWIDEAKNRQKLVDGNVEYYTDVEHFSIDAYKWLTSLYESKITDL